MKRIDTLTLKLKNKGRKKAELQDACELPPARQPRTSAFQPCQGDWHTVGGPQTEAEMASLVMGSKGASRSRGAPQTRALTDERAAVDLANEVLALPAETFVAEVEHVVQTMHTKTIQAKRRLDRHYRIEQTGFVGGYRLKSYDMIWPILEKGAAMAGRQIHVQAAACAQLASYLREAGRDPRAPLSLHGRPDLSDVADVTEPEGSAALMRAPEETANARSPLKREAEAARPMRFKAARLSETKVQLWPAPASRTEPSPVKSSPLAASSSVDLPAPRKSVAASPTPLDARAASRPLRAAAEQAPSSPLGSSKAPSDDGSTLRPETCVSPALRPASGDDDSALTPEAYTAAKVFRVPSDHGSMPSSAESTSLDSAGAETGDASASEAETKTPAKVSRAATGDAPSRSAERAETSPSALDSPATAGLAVASARAAQSQTGPSTSTPSWYTPGRSGARLGLVEAIPRSTPSLPQSKPDALDAAKSIRFDFGPTSPSFNSPSIGLLASPKWLVSRQAIGARRSNRRKSEPLLRTFFKHRTAARLSSPSKGTPPKDSPDKNGTVSALASSPQHEQDMPSSRASQQKVHTPDAPLSPASWAVGGAVTPAISWAKMTGRAGQRTPRMTSQASARKDVHSVDMSRGLNIFGGKQASPSKRRASAIDQLARIAEANCDGEAKVVVTQERGRLFVRFKLPSEFAFMFPQDQGLDESRFTTTPSVSSSPRIRVTSHSSWSTQGAASSTGASPAHTPAISHDADDTMVCDDFAPSLSSHDTHLSNADGGARDPREDGSPLLSMDETADFHIDEHSTIPWRDSSSQQGERAASALCSPDHPMDGSDGHPTETELVMTSDKEMTPVPDHGCMDGKTATQDDVEMSGQNGGRADAMMADATGVPYAAERPDRGLKSSVYYSPRRPLAGISEEPEQTQHREHGPATRAHKYDSPGREYMIDFINRSRPKRLSATETGSPVALSAKRHPLGAKDPNMDSPLMGQRRGAAGEREEQSPFRRGAAPALKHQPQAEGDEMEGIEPGKAARGRGQGGKVLSDEEMADAPPARRSSRLRRLNQPKTGPKKSVPTLTAASGRSGPGRGQGAAGRIKTDQQTRINTRKNRGNAEYPAQFLARHGGDAMDTDAPAVNHGGKAAKASAKSVGWKEPLEEKPRKGRPAARARATQGQTGVDKAPPRPSAAARKKRTAQVATGLGLGRVTRAAAARAQR